VTARPGSASGYAGWRRRLSLWLLVGVNLLPLAGVVWLDWDIAALVVLYWSENLVLGFYTLLKMLLVSPLGGLGMGCFFALHYGGFCAVHGLFVIVLMIGSDVDPMPGEPWPLFLVFVQLLVNVVREVLSFAPPAWIVAFAALFLSHGVSFVANFLLGPERQRQDLRQLMRAPYGRIVVLHLAILLGGFAVMALGQPLALLLVLVLGKLGLDIVLHEREHRALAGD
tara:strand:+ start:437 stop:1114 length:678 start_codon:yes stop_codon:yes gene_type:complete